MATSAKEPLKLPRFIEAIRARRDLVNYMTVSRYTRGELPKFAVLLADNPDIAAAFCADIQARRQLEQTDRQPEAAA